MPETLHEIESSPPEPEDWTLRRGLLRAAWRGALWAIVLAGLCAAPAIYMPAVMLSFWLRAALAFAIAWILIGAVQNASGTVGWQCNALAFVFTIAVLLSHHVIFAIHGVPTREGLVIGSVWLAPDALTRTNFVPGIVVAVVLWICDEGRPGGTFLTDLLRQQVWRI